MGRQKRDAMGLSAGFPARMTFLRVGSRLPQEEGCGDLQALGQRDRWSDRCIALEQSSCLVALVVTVRAVP